MQPYMSCTGTDSQWTAEPRAGTWPPRMSWREECSDQHCPRARTLNKQTNIKHRWANQSCSDVIEFVLIMWKILVFEPGMLFENCRSLSISRGVKSVKRSALSCKQDHWDTWNQNIIIKSLDRIFPNIILLWTFDWQLSVQVSEPTVC